MQDYRIVKLSYETCTCYFVATIECKLLKNKLTSRISECNKCQLLFFLTILEGFSKVLKNDFSHARAIENLPFFCYTPALSSVVNKSCSFLSISGFFLRLINTSFEIFRRNRSENRSRKLKINIEEVYFTF